MTKTLHVIFDGKVLRPEKPPDLEPNTHYIVTVESREAPEEKNLWEVLSNLTGTVEGPEDWSQEHDYYLYNVPKREKI